MSKERLEPIITGAFIGRDFVNRKDKLVDLTPPDTVMMSTRDFVACWVLILIGVVGLCWLVVNS
jgi:hypothetical protein